MASRFHPLRALKPSVVALSAAAIALVGTIVVAMPVALADVRFQDCQPAPGGGITCDTRPEGNTLLNDEAARFGLFDDASPGWNEYNPYQGESQMFGGY